MDNLFMSAKFAKIAMNYSGRKVMIHGVCRQNRGIPKSIMQEKVTTKQDVLKNKGTIKAAILVGDSKCTDLVTLSFYDSKPIYFITNACDKICWVRKNRKFWHQQKGRQVNVPFYRLNIVDEYNAGMGNVDIADQLRLQYRIHYWIRNQKWWWAIFFGVFECYLTNSYILYRKFYQVHGKNHLFLIMISFVKFPLLG